MFESFDPAFARWNYHSFVRDLSKRVVLEADEIMGGLKPPVPEGRGSLPRPARFGARTQVAQPSEAVKARLRDAVQLSPEAALLSLLKGWTADRFSYPKYTALLGAFGAAGAGPLARTLRRAFYDRDGIVLEKGLKYGAGEQVWVFNLAADSRVAAGAFARARELAQQSYNAVCNPDPMTISLLDFYFNGSGRRNRDRAPEWVTVDQFRGSRFHEAIRAVFERTNHGLNQNPCSIVLGPGEPRVGEGSYTLAYAGRQGASTREGSLVHLCPNFFQLRPGTPAFISVPHDRGATILHETTHLFAGTEDVEVQGGRPDACYGRANCYALPAALAAENADSYCLFALDLFHLKHPDGHTGRLMIELLRRTDPLFFSPPSMSAPPPPPPPHS